MWEWNDGIGERSNGNSQKLHAPLWNNFKEGSWWSKKLDMWYLKSEKHTTEKCGVIALAELRNVSVITSLKRCMLGGIEHINIWRNSDS